MSFIKNNVIYCLVVSIFLLIGFIFFYKTTSKDKNSSLSLENTHQLTNIVPVLILGSGPAGLSAALYTARAKLKTVVLSGQNPGGQLADVKYIENWPARTKTSGMDIMDDLKSQAQSFGAHVLYDAAKKIDLSTWPFTVTTENDLVLKALSLIYTTGGIPKKLEVPGVETYWGRGVGICTICDAAFHQDQTVAVVGGGDTGAERALQLSMYAKKVYVIVREPTLEAAAVVQDYLNSAKNITIVYNTEVTAIHGNEKSITDAALRNRNTQEETTIPVQGVYFAIGYHPNSDLVKDVIKTDKDGYIIVECGTQHTNVPGFFAAGIVAVPDKAYGKSGVASGSGIKAGMDAINFLEDKGFNPKIAQQLEKQFFVPSCKNSESLPSVTSLDELKAFYKKPHTKLLIYVHSSSCPHCRTMTPLVQDLADEYNNELTVVTIDHDKANELIKKLNIRRVPYLIFLKDGKVVWYGSTTTKQDLANIITEQQQQNIAQEEATMPTELEQ